MFQQQFIRNLERRADVPADRLHISVKRHTRALRIGNLHLLAFGKLHNRAVSELVCLRIGIDALHGGKAATAAEKAALVRRRRRHENREHAADHCGHQLSIAVALQLLELFNDRRKNRDASSLSRTLDIGHDVQDVASTCTITEDRHSAPFHLNRVRRTCSSSRVSISDIDCNGLSVLTDLNAPKNVFLQGLKVVLRVANAIGFDDPDTQVVHRANATNHRRNDKTVAAHQR